MWDRMEAVLCFLRNVQVVLHSGCTNGHAFPPRVKEDSLFSTPSSAFVPSLFDDGCSYWCEVTHQYSCLGNPMDRGVWWATVHGVTEESDTT